MSESSSNVIELTASNKFKGHKIEDTWSMSNERGDQMEINPKEYIDGKIDTLEKTMEIRLESQEKLLSEKIDHLHTKIEKTIGDKFSDYENKINAARKEDRKFYVTTALALAGVIVAVIAIWN
ncbi:hypothetical protein HMPREF1210_01118 [Paenisporosarcina sp. HGH0030]|uniref:hypothetical protein n=1 Tax=Paenisporosarcina sp. HGH0030 TaxID=1078085 RepID=UPI00034E3329|nr:hypothetical protein [Paenisporosarcina sp. HGH0030]EPD52738.1 hypothetical protein HMPREF1210_01118 [Paenisporosarcina sp. HGH0030]